VEIRRIIEGIEYMYLGYRRRRCIDSLCFYPFLKYIYMYIYVYIYVCVCITIYLFNSMLWDIYIYTYIHTELWNSALRLLMFWFIFCVTYMYVRVIA